MGELEELRAENEQLRRDAVIEAEAYVRLFREREQLRGALQSIADLAKEALDASN